MTTEDSAEAGAATTLPAFPDRLSTDPRSPYFDGDILARSIGIRFNDAEKHNVEEYCISEGWIRIATGKTRDRKGNPLTIKLNGVVQPFFRDAAKETL